jgi:hypothetical protein
VRTQTWCRESRTLRRERESYADRRLSLLRDRGIREASETAKDMISRGRALPPASQPGWTCSKCPRVASFPLAGTRLPRDDARSHPVRPPAASPFPHRRGASHRPSATPTPSHRTRLHHSLRARRERRWHLCHSAPACRRTESRIARHHLRRCRCRSWIDGGGTRRGEATLAGLHRPSAAVQLAPAVRSATTGVPGLSTLGRPIQWATPGADFRRHVARCVRKGRLGSP